MTDEERAKMRRAGKLARELFTSAAVAHRSREDDRVADRVAAGAAAELAGDAFLAEWTLRFVGNMLQGVLAGFNPDGDAVGIALGAAARSIERGIEERLARD